MVGNFAPQLVIWGSGRVDRTLLCSATHEEEDWWSVRLSS